MAGTYWLEARRLEAPEGTYDYSRAARGDLSVLTSSDPKQFATLFPVPFRWLLEEGHQQQQQEAQPQRAVAVDDDEDDDFWLSPRMAAKLQHQAMFLADQALMEASGKGITWLLQMGDSLPSLPRVVQPYASKRWWARAYADCFRRLGARLAKGHPPSPNCTGEEMALHQIIYITRELDGDLQFEAQVAGLPVTQYDRDYDFVNQLSVQDRDVLDLYNMRNLLPSSGPLHPSEWFFAFQPDRAQDHLPGTPWRDPHERPHKRHAQFERAQEVFKRMLDAQEALLLATRTF